MKNRLQAFGLVGWLEATKVQLPLKGVECRFQVSGDLLSVEIDQIFHQNSSKALDCLYSFPLPAGAAVYRCEMHVNGRVVRAKVEERGRAREIAREKKKAGYRTALVEMERDNLFTLSLGNLQPNDVVVIRFAYFQTLTRLQDWTSFHIPFCPGVRYIPGKPLLRAPSGSGVADDTDQVPDASRISPPRIDQLHPDASYLHVQGCVEDPTRRVREISSPTHPVLVRDGDRKYQVKIADAEAVPDRDLVLRWTEEPVVELSLNGSLLAGENASYALVRLQAPADVSVRAEGEGQDVYFLLDRSGSMQGLKWSKTAQAFLEFVRTLGPKDRVWATLFESAYQDFAEQPLPAGVILQDRMAGQLESIGTGGGTELLPALRHLLEGVRKHSGGRSASLVLVTDGQVGNEAEVLQLLREHPDLRTHTFGIDTAVNDGFLKQMACQQGGTCYLISPNDDIVGAVARLGHRLQKPILTAIKPQGDWMLAREACPDLHAGETISISVKGPAPARELILEGCLSDGEVRSYRCSLEPRPVPALQLLWARERIDHLLANENQAEALALAKENNLVCAGAAFIAWDEAEKVSLSEVEVYQHSLHQVMSLPAKRVPVARLMSFCDIKDSSTRYRRTRPQHFGDITENHAGSSWLDAVRRLISRWGGGKRPQVLSQLTPELLLQVAACRERVEKEERSYAPLSLAAFDIVCEWILDRAEEVEERLRLLEKLLDNLRGAPNDIGRRWQMLHDWVEANLTETGGCYRRMTELLQSTRVLPGAKITGEKLCSD